MLKGQSAIITGGSRGLGFATARLFVEMGARVLLIARNQDELKNAREQLNSPLQVRTLVGDVSCPDTAKTAVEMIAGEWQGPDILVNNAGVGTAASLLDTDPELWDEMMRVNARGTYLMCRQVAVSMIAGRIPGRIVNVSSVAGSIGSAMASAYSASKAAVLGFSRAVARELAPYGINVNCVCPGMIETGSFHNQADDYLSRKLGIKKEQLKEMTLQVIPQQRFLEPEEVARLIAFLASADARGITGQSYTISCGYDIH